LTSNCYSTVDETDACYHRMLYILLFFIYILLQKMHALLM